MDKQLVDTPQVVAEKVDNTKKTTKKKEFIGAQVEYTSDGKIKRSYPVYK